jgi:hypothetical protein
LEQGNLENALTGNGLGWEYDVGEKLHPLVASAARTK